MWLREAGRDGKVGRDCRETARRRVHRMMVGEDYDVMTRYQGWHGRRSLIMRWIIGFDYYETTMHFMQSCPARCTGELVVDGQNQKGGHDLIHRY